MELRLSAVALFLLASSVTMGSALDSSSLAVPLRDWPLLAVPPPLPASTGLPSNGLRPSSNWQTIVGTGKEGRHEPATQAPSDVQTLPEARGWAWGEVSEDLHPAEEDNDGQAEETWAEARPREDDAMRGSVEEKSEEARPAKLAYDPGTPSTILRPLLVILPASAIALVCLPPGRS